MKILYYHQHFSTPAGSTGTRSYEMAKALVARGHQVTIVCGSSAVCNTGLNMNFKKRQRRGYVNGIEVVEFELQYSNSDSFLSRTIKFFRFAAFGCLITFKEDFDLVFATSTPLTAGIPGIVAKIFRRKPFVFEVRDLWPELPKAMGVIKNPLILWLMSLLEWTAYRSSNGCIGLSPGIVDGIHKRGVKLQKIAMIPNGCDLDLFRNPHGYAELPDSIASSDFCAVFTGAHGMANGLDAVLDTAAMLKTRNRTDIKFLFIGAGKLKPQLKARAKTEELTSCIFMDSLPKLELAKLLPKCDVGLMILKNIPSFYYGTSPNKFFDYIAAGLPVINNYPGWLADLITENSCGHAIPPEDSTSFADALIKIADNRKSIESMSSNSRQLAREQFDRAQLANKFCEFLESKLP